MSDSRDEPFIRMLRKTRSMRVACHQTINGGSDVFGVMDNMHTATTSKMCGCRALMIIAMLAKCCPARHDQDRLVHLMRHQKSARARMGHDQVRAHARFPERLRRQKAVARHILGLGAMPRLRNNLNLRVPPCPVIHRLHQTRKRQLRSDREKNHMTAPA